MSHMRNQPELALLRYHLKNKGKGDSHLTFSGIYFFDTGDCHLFTPKYEKILIMRALFRKVW